MKYSIFLFFLFFYLIGYSQQCMPHYFLTQSDVDNFASDYPNCTHFYSIFIGGSDIVNLDGLTQIDSCFKLTIKETSLRDLSGLEGLTVVHRDISITNGQSGVYDVGIHIIDNPLLETLNGLENISRTSDLSIENNESLRNTDALNILEFKNHVSGIHDIGNNISIKNNLVLTNIVGLSGLINGGFIDIENNPSLVDISGFSNLSHLWCRETSLSNFDARFSIRNNDSLKNLDGLSNIYICGQLIIEDNEKLINLEGLDSLSVSVFSIRNNPSLEKLGDIDLLVGSSLTEYEDKFELINNPILKSIHLENFNSNADLNTLQVNIHENYSLEICNEEFLCDLIEDDDAIFKIENNSIGCNSVGEVENMCLINTVDIFKSEDILFYPNPASHTLNLQFASDRFTPDLIELTRLDGSLLFSDHNVSVNNYHFDVQNIPFGIYLLSVYTQDIIITKKVILGK